MNNQTNQNTCHVMNLSYTQRHMVNIENHKYWKRIIYGNVTFERKKKNKYQRKAKKKIVRVNKCCVARKCIAFSWVNARKCWNMFNSTELWHKSVICLGDEWIICICKHVFISFLAMAIVVTTVEKKRCMNIKYN